MTRESFHPAVERWFSSTFEAPTPVQLEAWNAIASGSHTVISAPTGSGKTLAAFLAVIDALVKQALADRLSDETRILYVSPLKALSNDVQKNLQQPLEGIRRELIGLALPDAPIRASVRTGDTPQSERAKMRRRPPHILVTTPESLYILLTSESGRRMLGTVRTVIVDEIHAVAGNKRGAHLALSLERLGALCGEPPTRVGISATTKPIARIAEYLTGNPDIPCMIIDAGHVRDRDLELDLPQSPLEAIMANEVWTEVYDRLAELIREHRTTLVFVNTRRLAERAARHLAERLGEDAVTSHHGSLAKEHRLRAEQRLKQGDIKAIVATSSLELGIDIGDVDLVCQLGSPRSIAALLQRVGRSGHGPQALPKGRLFPLSCDELVECAALLASVGRRELDAIRLCRGALDVLTQQIVAEVSMREWRVDELLALVRKAAPYRDIEPGAFTALVRMLAEGFSTQRGRRGAHLFFDRVNGTLRGRRGARLTAVTNGGAIPDQFDYDVVLLPNEISVGTLNEDFAFESLPGDIFQLGSTSYRILKVRTGKVYVEDAKGRPPNIPFWFGEAPGRSDELSQSVSALRERVDRELASRSGAEAAAALSGELGLSEPAAEQLVEYLAAARAALGLLPTAEKIVFERFFDEAGDTHLVIHSPLGARVNRAWGLALRKRFCRRFNFELQAAALDDSIVLSLGTMHSFALADVAKYLTSRSVRHVLTQAVVGAPIFSTYWRWNATIALAVRRFRNGKRAPPQFQRIDSEDLLATVFPEQLACAENLPGGDLAIPDHPLVTQTLADCLTAAMDIDGLERLLSRIEAGDVEILCRDLAAPSPLAQEILGAKRYAFLDDAPAEERRTLAVQSRRYTSVGEASELGRLDPAAIERVRAEAWPEVRNADELDDALAVLGFVTEEEGAAADCWPACFESLKRDGRATVFALPAGGRLWVGAQRLAELLLVFTTGRASPDARVLPSDVGDRDTALRELVRSRLEALGPVTAEVVAKPLGLSAAEIAVPLAALEQHGAIMRGAFISGADTEQWCERRLLARIHRYTLKRLRSEIEPVSLADYQRFLFHWQGLAADRREGREALRAVLGELQGLALPAAVWEREVLPARVEGYGTDLIDELSASGEIVWWRPRLGTVAAAGRSVTVAASPMAIVPRVELLHWRLLAESRNAAHGPPGVSGRAERVLRELESRGALFFVELVQHTRLLRVEVENALGELVANGLVTADAFSGLRALIAPQRRRQGFSGRSRTRRRSVSFDAAGRWAVIEAGADAARDPAAASDAVEAAARALLRRYGVVARGVLAREALAPSWRELVTVYRRWEARGELRGGRFVDVLGGEQFALSEAVESLRRVRRAGSDDEWVVISAADPLNLAGLISGDKRVAAVAVHRVAYRRGVPVAARQASGIDWLAPLDSSQKRHASALLDRSTGRSRDRPPFLARRGR
ncbi:Lhr family helicase [Candidatus Rariloculus sp.]|uniref:Lhr family helicase n=1 Tax=Candidatus Rariloculus sp. TaxID=3101265 RepID=UPI003D11C8C4